MIDLLERVADLIRESGHGDVACRRLDELTGREGIVVRPVPSTIPARYWDRSRQLSYAYQVVVRRRSEREAMEVCQELEALLDGADVPSSNGSYEMAGQEVYTPSQELGLSESGFYAWQFRVTASLTVF